MAGLIEPFDTSQAALCDIVWHVFAAHGRFPIYAYVSYQMEQRGLDVDEVLASLPSIEMLLHRRYRAIDYTSGGGLPQPESQVYLTMAGLYQVRDHRAMEIIRGMLAYLRAMSKRRESIGADPFEVVNVDVGLQEALEQAGIEPDDLAFIAAVAEHEWPGMSVTCPSPERTSEDDKRVFCRFGLVISCGFDGFRLVGGFERGAVGWWMSASRTRPT